MKRNILGPRIRERRKDIGISQAELARKIEISASYLNLIEHNKRVISGSLLGKVAQALDIPLEQLDGAADRQLLETLEEMSQSAEIQTLGVEASNIGELIGRFPGWARGIAALRRSERKATGISQVLADRLNHDPFLGEIVHKLLTRMSSLRSAAEIIDSYPDIEPGDRDRFNAIIHEESRHLGDLGDSLAAYFDNAAASKRDLTPMDEVDSLFDARSNHFAEIESRTGRLTQSLEHGAARDRFAAALDTARQKLHTTVDGIVDGHEDFQTEIARTRAREMLFRYAALAILLPLDQFKQLAQEHDYDIEKLSSILSIEFELICERLSALPQAEGTPNFGYFQTNASATLLLSRNLPNLAIPRYGSVCPLWALFRAQQTPENLLHQFVQMPSGEKFVFIARARNNAAIGYGQPCHYLTDMVALTEQEAALTVYAPDRWARIEATGISCRTCTRDNCSQRVLDPLFG